MSMFTKECFTFDNVRKFLHVYSLNPTKYIIFNISHKVMQYPCTLVPLDRSVKNHSSNQNVRHHQVYKIFWNFDHKYLTLTVKL